MVATMLIDKGADVNAQGGYHALLKLFVQVFIILFSADEAGSAVCARVLRLGFRVVSNA
jgi:hypothetical protein